METIHTKTPLTQPPAGPPRELLKNSGFLLKRLGWTFKERALEAFEPTGLNPQHHAILALLDEGTRETQGTIADALGYDRSQLVGLLDELEERGFVDRQRDRADRRRHLVSLTPEGKKALSELRAISKRVEKDFLAPLDDEERRALHALLLELAVHHDARCAPWPAPDARA
jgi:MarR family transcriptional regulator, lower aerobic nicotinate degradation pathway regulator